MAIISLPPGARRLFVGCLLLSSSLDATEARSAERVPSADIVADARSDLKGIRPDHLWTGDYLQLVFGDTKAVLVAPVHWDQEQWQEVAAAAAGIGATAVFDRSIRNHVQAGRTAGEDRFMNRWQNIDTLVLLGGFEAWGELGGDIRAKNVAMDGLASSLIASALIAPSLKLIVGRERPNKTSATFKFRPFSGNLSFPSGHATQAFAVATVIAENYPIWWIKGLAYGSAALIGYARIEQNAHYASDVVAGALLGCAVSRAIVYRHNGPHNPRKLSWIPYAGGGGSGLMFFKSF